MKGKTRKIARIMIVVLLIGLLAMLPPAYAEEAAPGQDEERPSEEIVFNEYGASVYRVLNSGMLWKLRDCLVYVPGETNAETKFLVHFAGGCGGWYLRKDYVERYLNSYEPNAVMIFFCSSLLDGRRTLHSRVFDIWETVSDLVASAPQDIAISGSSMGGYSALYVAANLMRDYGVRTEKVLIYDMGYGWKYTDAMISKEEAEPMMEANTVVYAFSKKDNIYRYRESRAWLDYGIRTIEVACVNHDHDGITSLAFRNGTFSWAIGEREELDPDQYTLFEAKLE